MAKLHNLRECRIIELRAAVLENAVVRLEPLAEVRRELLRAACAADPEIWATLSARARGGCSSRSTPSTPARGPRR